MNTLSEWRVYCSIYARICLIRIWWMEFECACGCKRKGPMSCMFMFRRLINKNGDYVWRNEHKIEKHSSRIAQDRSLSKSAEYIKLLIEIGMTPQYLYQQQQQQQRILLLLQMQIMVKKIASLSQCKSVYNPLCGSIFTQIMNKLKCVLFAPEDSLFKWKFNV